MIHDKCQIDSAGDRNLLFKEQVKNNLTAHVAYVYYRKAIYSSKMTVESLTSIDPIFFWSFPLYLHLLTWKTVAIAFLTVLLILYSGVHLLDNIQAIPLCLGRQLLRTAFSPVAKGCLVLIPQKFPTPPKAVSVPTCQHLILLKKVWAHLWPKASAARS